MACLAPLRDQTHGNVETIVVDNFSTDGTRLLAAPLADQVLVAGPERSSQRNIGAAAATGGILVFLDSDMRAPRNLAQEIVRGLERLPPTNALVLPEISSGEGYWAKCKRLEKLIYMGDPAVEAARAFPADSFWALGGFDEELPPGTEDWDLSDRVRESGGSITRAAVRVTHDEGHLSLLLNLRKKYYYGRSVRSYFGRRPGQVVPKIVRTAFIRRSHLLFGHPLLATGLVIMKGLELGAVLSGAAASLAGFHERIPMPNRRTAKPKNGRLAESAAAWRIFGPRALAGRLRESVRAARAFKNWPTVVLRSFLSYLTGPGGDLLVRTRTGLVLHCPNDPLDRWPIFEVLADDAYHLGDLTKLDSFESLTVLDIGAHVGAFALAVARRFPHCTVACYEPNPRLAPYLRRNVRANGMAERISVEQRAVGAAQGHALLYDAGCASTILPGLRSTSSSATEVEVVAFEEVMSRLGERAHLVKLDCEGSEYGIALDTPEVTWRGVEQVLLEYEEPVAGRSWPVLRSGLEALGFEVRWHERRPEEPDVGMAYLVRATGRGPDRGDA